MIRLSRTFSGGKPLRVLPRNDSMSTLQQNRPGISRLEALSNNDAIKSRRRQHQAVAVDYEHREAMRMFVDSLNVAVAAFPPLNTGYARKSNFPEDAWTRPRKEERKSGESVKSSNQPKRISKAKEEVNSKPTIIEQLYTDQHFALGKAIKARRVDQAVALFEESVENDSLVPMEMVVNLFYLVVKRDPITAYDLLCYSNSHPESTEFKDDMYRRICFSVGLLDPQRARHATIMDFADSLLADLDKLDLDAKKKFYPPLAVSFAKQKSVAAGPYAGALYNFLVENDFPMTKGWLQSLLGLSKYNRQDDLPFHDILAQLVAIDAQPHPLSVIPAIQNMFPYTDSESVRIALTAYRDLLVQNQDKRDESNYYERMIDLTALEMIAAGAAHSGDTELISLVWDVLELCKYNPTEAIYENTIVSLAAGRTLGDVEQVFTAMVSMKEEGFEVSRPLIRSVSRILRSNWALLRDSMMFLRDDETPDNLKALESFNVLMSSYAERGDVRQTMDLLNSLTRYNLNPNVESYSFAIEALGKDIHRRKKEVDRAWLHKNIEMADAILTQMEDENVSPSADVVRNYVELLCLAGEVSTATSVVDDLLSTKQTSLMTNKTLYRAALANVEDGNIDKANELASATSEVIPVLHRKIDSKAQRLMHLENMKRRQEYN